MYGAGGFPAPSLTGLPRPACGERVGVRGNAGRPNYKYTGFGKVKYECRM